jgi:dolichol-phosphate mannosyltransferase
MDSDLQHDETALRAMLEQMRRSDVDLVVGSRYMVGGSTGEWAKHRVWASKLATKLATHLTKTPMTDPMSGFFMVRPEAFRRSLDKLSIVGFKILLDVAASAPQPLKIVEVPYTFRPRQHGESKLDTLVLWEYVQLLLDKTFGHLIPIRFISFVLVGGSGVFVHFTILTAAFKALSLSFGTSQAVATFVATSSNFFLNNMLTYRDQRLKGRRLFIGWVTFNLVCATGAVANVGVARWLFEHNNYWALSALAGIALTTVWNFAMSAFLTWRKRS